MLHLRSYRPMPSEKPFRAKATGSVPRSKRSARRRKLAFFALLSCGGWLCFTVVRSRHLISQGELIAQHSASFERDYYVGNTARPALTYLVMGDSTAAGWGAGQKTETYPYRVAAHVASHGYRVHVVVVAVGGARLRDVVKGQLPTLRSLRPQLVTLSVGANDATHFTSQAEFARDLTTLLAELHGSKARHILIADTPDMYQAPALPWPLAVAINVRARQQNQLLREATHDSPVQLVDLYTKGKLVYGRDPNLYAADLFHPSSAGYGSWAQLFQEQLPVEKGKLQTGAIFPPRGVPARGFSPGCPAAPPTTGPPQT